jgi:hypothetical protein
MDLTTTDNDFDEKEVERINTFVANGCIGLETLSKDEHKINAIFGLYMSGRTYTEISKVSKVKKDLVLYMAAKFNWYEKRMEYINDIQKQMTKKLTNTRIQSLNFISNLISVHHKYYGEEIDKYLMTGDRDIIDNLDLKQLSQYFKSIEILEKVMNPANLNRGGSGTTVNINTPDGGKVEQLDSKTLQITPGKTGDVLRALAAKKDKDNEDED